MTHRPTIAGSVSPRGTRFLAQVPPSMGRRGKLHDSQEAAWAWLREESAKLTLGVIDVANPVHIVGALIDQWLARQSLKESTREDYRIRINKHIKGNAFGALVMRDVLPMDVDRVLGDTPQNWTRIHVAKILSTFFDWAEANRLTTGNPYRQSQATRICQTAYRVVERRDSTDNVWTPEQFMMFVGHESDPVYRDYWVWVAATAARRGEGIGLCWANTHTAEGWAWLEDNVTTAGSKIIHSETPKSHKRRKVYFPPIIGAMLDARKADQDEYRAQCTEWQGDWVFDRRRGKGKGFGPGIHLAPATVTQRFNRHTEELGLPALSGPHGLRRTFATLAEEAGFKKSARTAALGHTPDIGGRYTKASEGDMRALAERLTQLIVPLAIAA